MTSLLVWLSACNPPLVFDSSGPLTDTGDTSIDTARESGESGVDDTGDTAPVDDLDGDGFTVDEGDCDDTDGARYPGAAEALDGQDDDCDGAADEAQVEAWAGAARIDGDGLGFGSALAVSLDSAGTTAEYVAVGAPVGAVGAVYVFGVDDVSADTSVLDAQYTLTGPTDGGAVGAFLLYERLNGDTYADLVAGDPSWSGSAGAVHFLDGARIRSGGSGSVASATISLEGTTLPPGMFGRSLAAAEGYLFVGAPLETGEQGAFYAYDADEFSRGAYGSAADGGRVAAGTEIGLGMGMSTIDWDSDGASDLVVTAPGSTGGGIALSAGRALVWTADALPALVAGADTSSASATVDGHVLANYLGYAASGDFDGDGAEDLVLSSWIGPMLVNRSVVVVSGGSDAVSTEDAQFSVSGLVLPASDAPGIAAADIDGDGIDELLVGDFGDSPGRALIFGFAGTNLTGVLEPEDASASIEGAEVNDEFASTMVGLLNNGAAEDLLLGAPGTADGAVFYVPSGF